MEGIDHRIYAGKDIAVTFLGWPVHDVSVVDLLRCARHQPVGPYAFIEQPGLQSLVVGREPCRVPGLHPIRVRDEHHMRGPLGGPGRELHEPIKGRPGHLRIGVSGVVAQLGQIGICFISKALAIAIDKDAGKGSRLDRVVTEIPDSVQDLVRRAEGRIIVVPCAGKGCKAPNLIRVQLARPSLNLDPAKGQQDSPVRRGQHRRRLGVASVRRRSHTRCPRVFQSDLYLGISH